jgi:uncharacterized membrane protein YfcA
MNPVSRPARRGLPHIRQWYGKMLYVIAVIAIWYLGAGLVQSDEPRGILRAVLLLVLVLLGARLFRSPEEPDDAARPRWRMTGRPLAGWVLGTVAGLGAIWLFVAAIGTELAPASAHVASSTQNLAVFVALAIALAALAVLYLTSSVRLRSLAKVEPAKTPAQD